MAAMFFVCINIKITQKRKKKKRKVRVFHFNYLKFYLVCSNAASLCRQSDIGETFVGKQSAKDVEQVVRVVFPFQAKLMMIRHD